MKRLIYAVIVTCLGVILIGLNTKEHKPALPEAPTSHVEAVQEPIQPDLSLIAQEPVEAIVEAPSTPVEQPVIHTYTGTNQELYALAGIPESDWAGVERIYSQESGVCHLKWQGQYGACPTTYVEPYPGAETDSSKGYGICQSTPAIKMASEGEDWRTNPATQMRWCYKYTLAYGSVQEAINFKYCLGSCYSTRTRTTVWKNTPWF